MVDEIAQGKKAITVSTFASLFLLPWYVCFHVVMVVFCFRCLENYVIFVQLGELCIFGEKLCAKITLDHYKYVEKIWKSQDDLLSRTISWTTASLFWNFFIIYPTKYEKSQRNVPANIYTEKDLYMKYRNNISVFSDSSNFVLISWRCRMLYLESDCSICMPGKTSGLSFKTPKPSQSNWLGSMRWAIMKGAGYQVEQCPCDRWSWMTGPNLPVPVRRTSSYLAVDR